MTTDSEDPLMGSGRNHRKTRHEERVGSTETFDLDLFARANP